MVRRHCLVVCSRFPPAGGSGVQRVAKWARHLPALGWSPAVLTMRERPGYPRDPSLLAGLPSDPPVERTRAIDAWVLGSALGSRGVHAIGSALRLTASFPDADVGWVPSAVVRGLALARRHRARVVLSSAPNWSAHLVGSLLARLLGLPWVADFRDEWTDHPTFVGRGLHARLARRLEDAWLAHADLVIATSRASRDRFRERGARRAEAIRNGFDPDDLPGAPWAPAPRGEALSFLYAGAVYGPSDPRTFLSVLARLIERGEIPASEVRVRFAGAWWDHRVEASHPWLEVLGYVEHASLAEEYRRAHVLLLFMSGWPRCVLGKLFECAATGRPCLSCVQPDGETARLLREARAGIEVPWGDEGALAEAILGLHRAWREDRLPGGADPAVVSQWTRRRGAEQLAALLDEVVVH
ncbi:MAG: glycosyltransferase [Planctomycetes bacterium]|nr:glycosyltransferase [Planctomycetota bacterium]